MTLSKNTIIALALISGAGITLCTLSLTEPLPFKTGKL